MSKAIIQETKSRIYRENANPSCEKHAWLNVYEILAQQKTILLAGAGKETRGACWID